MREPKLLQGLRPKLRLLGACLAILLLGAFSRPPAALRPAPEEKVAPILEARALREEPLRLLEGLREKARRGASAGFSLLASPPRLPALAADYGPVARPRKPAGRGVVVAEGVGLSVASALEGALEPRLLLASGAVSPARVRAHDPQTGLVLLAVNAAASVRLGARSPEPGDLVLAAFGSGEQETIRPVFVAATDGLRLALSGAAALVHGTPLFDLEGALLAIASDDREAVRVTPALEALRLRADTALALPATLGLALQEMDAALTARLGPGAVAVAHAAPDGPGAALAAGDVLLAVAGHSPASLAEAQQRIAALPPGQEATLRVRRGGRELERKMTPVLALVHAAAPAPATSGPRADALFPAAALAGVALPPDARVLAIDGRPPRSRPRAGPSGLFLVEAEFEGQRLLAALKP